MKICTKCGKSDGPFPLKKGGKDGLSAWCSPCHAKVSREYYAKHKEERQKYSHEYRINHMEWRRRYDYQYRIKHPEKEHRKTYNFRNTHKDEIRKRIKKWILANPEKPQTYAHNYRAAKLKAAGNHTGIEWKTLKSDYDNRCIYCNKQVFDLDADHIIPLSRGGNNDISNIAPACKSCNRSKQDTPLLLWMLNRVAQ